MLNFFANKLIFWFIYLYKLIEGQTKEVQIMDNIKFQQEITDRLGNTPVAYSLKTCFLHSNTMLAKAAEIRIRASMPLCVIDGNKNKFFIDANGNSVLAEWKTLEKLTD